jgi:hypothetical protein
MLELMTKEHVFGFRQASRLEQVDDENSERTKEAVVGRIIAGPRTMFAIRMEFSEGTGVLQTGTIVPSLRHPAAAVSPAYASRGGS